MKTMIALVLTAFICVTINSSGQSSLSYLKNKNGKYPSDIKLFTTGPLKDRLQKLLGSRYKTFIDNMGTQIPIEVTGNTLFTSGCLPHSCGSDEAAICIFFNSNIIRGGIISNNQYFAFSEKSVSEDQFPEGYVNWLTGKGIKINANPKTKPYAATGIVVGDEQEGNNYYRVDIKNADGTIVSIWGPHSTWNKVKYYKNNKIVNGIKKGDKIGVMGTKEDSGIVPERIDIL